MYVWHALMGYWGGVRPGAASMAEFDADLVFPVPSPSVLHNQPDMAHDSLTLNGLGVVHPSKILSFYDAMHSYLAACGVDGVKVRMGSQDRGVIRLACPMCASDPATALRTPTRLPAGEMELSFGNHKLKPLWPCS